MLVLDLLIVSFFRGDGLPQKLRLVLSLEFLTRLTLSKTNIRQFLSDVEVSHIGSGCANDSFFCGVGLPQKLPLCIFLGEFLT